MKGKGRNSIAGLMIGALAGVIVLASVTSAAGRSKLEIDKDAVDQGGSFLVSGSGYAPSKRVKLIGRKGDVRDVIDVKRVNDNGKFKERIDVRRKAEPGRYRIVGCVEDGRRGCAGKRSDTIRVKRK